MWDRLFARHRDAKIGLQGQIRQMLVTAILDEQLPGGSPLPSSRELAEALGVARNTVVLAYQQLADEGYLVSRERSGHFVNPEILRGRVRGAPAGPAAASAAANVVALNRRVPDWSSRLRVQPTAQRNIVKPADWQKYPYPFLYGQFDASLFPTADWRECCMKALSVLDIRDWAPDLILRDDPDPGAADPHARFAAPRRVGRGRRDRRHRRRTARAVPGRGPAGGRRHHGRAREPVLSRCAQPVRLAHRAATADRRRCLRLPVMAALAGCDYVYVTPSHQCPTTVTMPLERREALLRDAEAHDYVVIEDDYEAESVFEGEPTPALKSLDRCDRVIYVGSLSKSFARGCGSATSSPPRNSSSSCAGCGD